MFFIVIHWNKFQHFVFDIFVGINSNANISVVPLELNWLPSLDFRLPALSYVIYFF